MERPIMSDQTSAQPDVLVERNGNGVVVVTLNRPERKNAIADWSLLAGVFGEIVASRSHCAKLQCYDRRYQGGCQGGVH
jgi:hypothetical protein